MLDMFHIFSGDSEYIVSVIPVAIQTFSLYTGVCSYPLGLVRPTCISPPLLLVRMNFKKSLVYITIYTYDVTKTQSIERSRYIPT